jgi:competence protein ComEC
MNTGVASGLTTAVTWRNLRFAVPAVMAWGALAITVSTTRALPRESHWCAAAGLIALGCIAVIVGAGLSVRAPATSERVIDRARESVFLAGFMIVALAVALWSRVPLERPRFGASTSFDVEWATELRNRLVEAARILPEPGNQLVAGLAVGDTSLLKPALDQDMKAVSLTHLVAVSGANCAIVVAGVVAVVAACGGGRWMRTLSATLALALFVTIVGPQPSVIRASVMAAILLVSVSFGQPSRGVPVLGVAVLCLLVVDPEWAVDVGFTLSVLATGALLLLAPPLARRLSEWMPHRLALLISIPLAAELVCQPVVGLLTPGLPVYGILANILTEPAAPVATVTGISAAVVLGLSPAVGSALLWLCWIPAQWIACVAHACARLPFARTVWLTGLCGLAASLLMSAGVIAALLWPRARRTAAIVVALTLGVSVTTTVIVDSWRRVGTPADWVIAACDVGQGDALLVRPSASAQSVMMIDTGRDEPLLSECLDRLGVSRVSLLVLTHYDIDHCGAYPAVAQRVDRAIVGKPVDLFEQGVVEDLRDAGAEVQYGRAGLSGDLGEAGFRWRELWPVPGHPDMQSGNPGSLVIRTDWAGEPDISAIFLGDLGEEAQHALLSSTAVKPVTIVKVAHHGSADQSTQLYERLHALIGLISVGEDNGYGHPTDRALTLLAESQTQVYRTDRHGLLLVRRAVQRLEVWSAR